jgi:EVE domain
MRHPVQETQASSHPQLFAADAAPRSWIAVACADHVARGRQLGIMQVCHGKGNPLRRLQAGDRVAYYSPTIALGGGARLQAFTAMGTVSNARVYQADMGDGFTPFRRDVAWRDSRETPIQRLLTRLELTRDKRNWGYVFRFGLVKISEGDMDLIFDAMVVSPHAEVYLNSSGIDWGWNENVSA